jgi:hypothetical protein
MITPPVTPARISARPYRLQTVDPESGWQDAFGSALVRVCNAGVCYQPPLSYEQRHDRIRRVRLTITAFRRSMSSPFQRPSILLHPFAVSVGSIHSVRVARQVCPSRQRETPVFSRRTKYQRSVTFWRQFSWLTLAGYFVPESKNSKTFGNSKGGRVVQNTVQNVPLLPVAAALLNVGTAGT